jgi:hypothetical protein
MRLLERLDVQALERAAEGFSGGTAGLDGGGRRDDREAKGKGEQGLQEGSTHRAPGPV